MKGWNSLIGGQGSGVSDEEILNVLRTSENLVLGTVEIAEAVNMSDTGVANRLDGLVDAGRVKKQKVGPTLVWGLDPDERQEPIQPELAYLANVFERIRSSTETTKFLGGVILLLGFGLMFAGLTGALVSTSIDVVSNQWLVAQGYAVAASGGAVWLFGGSIIWGTIVAERVAEWRLETQTLSSDTTDGATRGQTPLYILTGLAVLVVVIPLIFKVALDIRATTSSISGVPPGIATLFSLGIVLFIIAAIFQ